MLASLMSNPFDFRMIHFIDQPVVECIFETTKQNSTKEIETNKLETRNYLVSINDYVKRSQRD